MSTKQYYWLVTKDDTGKVFLIYGATDEESARQKGLEMLSGDDFEIKRLPTRNLAMASSLYKGNKLEQTHSLKEASKRLGHEKSLRRDRRRLARRE